MFVHRNSNVQAIFIRWVLPSPPGAQWFKRNCHEWTNQIAIYFSPKVILAGRNSCSLGRAGNHPVNVRRSRSAK